LEKEESKVIEGVEFYEVNFLGTKGLLVGFKIGVFKV
jgi:hypothetical protein